MQTVSRPPNRLLRTASQVLRPHLETVELAKGRSDRAGANTSCLTAAFDDGQPFGRPDVEVAMVGRDSLSGLRALDDGPALTEAVVVCRARPPFSRPRIFGPPPTERHFENTWRDMSRPQAQLAACNALTRWNRLSRLLCARGICRQRSCR